MKWNRNNYILIEESFTIIIFYVIQIANLFGSGSVGFVVGIKGGGAWSGTELVLHLQYLLRFTYIERY